MPPWTDVYALAKDRNEEAVEAFVAAYVSPDATREAMPFDANVLPLRFEGHEDDLPLLEWELVLFDDLGAALRLGLSRPWRAFRVYLPPRPPWQGAVLCFTRTGEVIFGLAAEGPEDDEMRSRWLAASVDELRSRVAGVVGWAVEGGPPPLDPWLDRPWDGPEALVGSSPPAGRSG